MYTPKLMFITFNMVLLATSILVMFRGFYNGIPEELHAMESITTRMKYSSRICTVGGAMVFTLTLFGFWCADSESRGGLITYKILMFSIIGLEAVVIFYYAFDEGSVEQVIAQDVLNWNYTDYTGFVHKIEQIQAYLRCCNHNIKVTEGGSDPSCCTYEIRITPITCLPPIYFKEKCHEIIPHYFRYREARYAWYFSKMTISEVASVIFTDMVIRKITILRDMLLIGKLP